MDFYRDIARWYDRFFPLSERKVAFFSDLLSEEGTVSVLDLACGPGELSNALARNSFVVTGIDSTAEFFDDGPAAESGAGTPAFCAARMEALPFYGEELFDAVICAGNSLPHLDEHDHIETVIRQCARVLRKQGLFCVQAIDFALVRKRGTVTLPELRFEQGGARICLRRFYRVDDAGAAFTPELIIDDVFAHYRIPMYPLEYDQLWKMLRTHGFSHVETYSDYRKTPWDETTPSYITLARKND